MIKSWLIGCVTMGFVLTAAAAGVSSPMDGWYIFDMKGTSTEVEDDFEPWIDRDKWGAAIVIYVDQEEFSYGAVILYEKGDYWLVDLPTFDLDFHDENKPKGVTSIEMAIDSPQFSGEILGFGKYSNMDRILKSFSAKGVGIGEAVYGPEDGADVSLSVKIRYNRKLTAMVRLETEAGMAAEVGEYVGKKAKVSALDVKNDLLSELE